MGGGGGSRGWGGPGDGAGSSVFGVFSKCMPQAVAADIGLPGIKCDFGRVSPAPRRAAGLLPTHATAAGWLTRGAPQADEEA